MLQALSQPIAIRRLLDIAAECWRAGLQQPICSHLPRWLTEDFGRIEISPRVQGYHVKIVGSRATEAFECVDLGNLAETIGTQTASARGRRQIPHQIIFRLPRDSYIAKEITLPAAAMRKLNAAVEFQLETETPFLAADVYFSARLREHQTTAQQIVVDLLIAPRARLDSTIKALQDANIRPDIITTCDDLGAVPRFNLCQHRSHPKRSKLHLASYGLVALLIVQLIAAACLPLALRQRAADEFQRQAEQMAHRANLISQDFDKAAKGQADVKYALEKRAAYISLIDTLDNLTQALPKDSWLNRISFKSNRLEISGYSPSTSKLTDGIAKNGRFDQAVYLAPSIKDAQSNLERFNLSFKLSSDGAKD